MDYEEQLTPEEQCVLLQFIGRHSRNSTFLRHEWELRQRFAMKLQHINFPLEDVETWRMIGDNLVAEQAANADS